MASRLQPGLTLGPYELFERAGPGSPPETWRAYHVEQRRFVELRLLPCPPDRTAEWLERFRRETQALIRLNHPNILLVEDVGEAEGWVYLAAPHREGLTLRYLLGEPWPLAEALLVVEPLASALDYAHGRHVHHGRISPDEVLVTEDGEVALLGFGAAWIGDSSAPERSETGDVSGLGAIAFELLVGRAPFPDEQWPSALPNAAATGGQSSSLPSNLQPAVIQALARTIEPATRERFTSSGAFVRALALGRRVQRANLAAMTPVAASAAVDRVRGGRIGRLRARLSAVAHSWRRVAVSAGAAVLVLTAIQLWVIEPALAMLAGRGGQASVSLSNSAVLAASGCLNDVDADRLASTIRSLLTLSGREKARSLSSTALLYSPGAPFWSPHPRAVTPRCHGHGLQLEGGSALIVGGIGPDDQPVVAAERYEPQTDSWSSAGRIWIARRDFAALALAGGQAFVIGGQGPAGEALASVERFDAGRSSWSLAPSMIQARRLHSATLLGAGQVLVVGGLGREGGPLSTVERWEPRSGLWLEAPQLRQPRARHSATLLDDGRVVIVGGSSGRAMVGSTEAFVPRAGSWERLGQLSDPRVQHTATLLNDGALMVVGGIGSGGALRSVERLDPVSGQWRRVADLPSARVSHSAALLTDGRLLLIGGREDPERGPYLSSTLLYEPLADRWSRGPDLPAW